MKIYTIAPLLHNRNHSLRSARKKQVVQNRTPQYAEFPAVSANLALVSFYGTGKNKKTQEEQKTIKPAKRLSSGDYKISKYIAEISKARYLHGDKAVVDLSMGNPDLTPPEKAKQALKDKVNDLWSHRYNNPKGDGYFFHTAADWFKKRFGVTIDPRKEIMVNSESSDASDHIFTA